MSTDNISSGIEGILNNGIDLKLESIEEEYYYITQMCEYFNEESDFKAYLTGTNSFELEFDRTSPIMEVVIKSSTLFMIPYIEDVFEVFAIMLGFIAKNHERIISETRGAQEYTRIQTPEEIILNKDESPPEEKREDTNDNDSDDFEWI